MTNCNRFLKKLMVLFERKREAPAAILPETACGYEAAWPSEALRVFTVERRQGAGAQPRRP